MASETQVVLYDFVQFTLCQWTPLPPQFSATCQAVRHIGGKILNNHRYEFYAMIDQLERRELSPSVIFHIICDQVFQGVFALRKLLLLIAFIGAYMERTSEYGGMSAVPTKWVYAYLSQEFAEQINDAQLWDRVIVVHHLMLRHAWWKRTLWIFNTAVVCGILVFLVCRQ